MERRQNIGWSKRESEEQKVNIVCGLMFWETEKWEKRVGTRINAIQIVCVVRNHGGNLVKIQELKGNYLIDRILEKKNN